MDGYAVSLAVICILIIIAIFLYASKEHLIAQPDYMGVYRGLNAVAPGDYNAAIDFLAAIEKSKMNDNNVDLSSQDVLL